MDTLEAFIADERKAIVQLRNNIVKEKEYDCELLNDDLILYKFLKGCDFKLTQAEKMLKKHIKWRRAYQVDRILQDYKELEVLELYLSQSFIGFDKDGCVVRYSAAGNVDIDGLLMSATFQDLFKCVVHLIESDIKILQEQTQKIGKTVSQFVYIYNLENLTLAKALNKKNLDLFMLGTTLFQDNYPERLKSVHVINAPSFFTLPFTILKSVISSGLLKKMKVFGHHGWKESLLEIIDEDVLPAFMGGKRTDPDGNPLCNTIINHGYPVPEKYYLINNMMDFRNRNETKQLKIKKQSKIKIDIFVENGGSFIEWEIEVKPKDIGFGMIFENDAEDGSKITELIPVHRIETPNFPENGMYYCEKSGRYTIIFDNSYSFWTSKEVLYIVYVNCTN